ncbi:CNH domain-containing protein [Mycena leptocephala]|nr:CNH domain-containing protein [Mycena leptocephala]
MAELNDHAEGAVPSAHDSDVYTAGLGAGGEVPGLSHIFELRILSTETFLVPSAVTSERTSSDGVFTGKVMCSVPFSMWGQKFVAVGCAEGLWCGICDDSRSFRRVLETKMVTQCAVLEKFGIFLVLASKSLFAYRIEDVIPTSSANNIAPRPQKLYNNVQFFRVGSLLDRTLVIAMQPKKCDSIFRVLEAVMDKNRKATERAHRFSVRQTKSHWFKKHKHFVLPSVSFDIIFLKATIAIVYPKGFEILDLARLTGTLIPNLDEDNPRLARPNKSWHSCRPMSMFRSTGEEVLLCYNEFGLYIDKHGNPTEPIVEWEGSAERIALHAPYILLFHTQTIEVREIATGRLAQIIPGHDMHCIWDHHHPESVGDVRVHGVMNILQDSPQPGHPVAQRIFELVPTGAISLPESSQRRSTPSNAPGVKSTVTSRPPLELQSGLS